MMRKSSISLLPIILIALGVVWNCTDENTTSPVPAGLRIHEWGVLVGCLEDTDYFMTSRPEIASTVREPIIYIHSSDKDPVTIRATFSTGTPTHTYPQAVVDDSTVAWENVTFAASKHLTPLDTADHVPLESIIDDLSDVDADMLNYSGTITNFLFYEGIIPFVNRVTVEFSPDSSDVTLTNIGAYPVYDIQVARPLSSVSPAIARLDPGEEVTVDINLTTNTGHFTQQLVSYGFTTREAVAFSKLWARPLLWPDVYFPEDKTTNLIYRLSQEEYDELISLTVEPSPDAVLRALYILIHI
jgi:hypothetical protein